MAKKIKKVKAAAAPAAVKQPVKAGGNRLVLGAVLVILSVITVIEIFSVAGINIRMSKKPLILAHWRPGSGYTGQTSMHVYGKSVYFVDASRSTMMENDVMTGNLLRFYSLAGGIHGMARLSNGDVLVISGGNTIVKFPAGSVKPVLPGKTIKDCGMTGFLAVDSKDNVYAVDLAKRVLIKCDRDLNRISEIGKGELIAPKRVYAGPGGAMYVIDFTGPKKTMVKVFGANGGLVRKFRVLKNLNSSGYTSLAVTPLGEVYVNNQQGSGVMCYGPKGRLLGSFTATADNTVNLLSPSGIAGGMEGFFVVPAAEILVLKDIKY